MAEIVGVTQHMMGDFTLALQSYQRALAIRIKLFGEERKSTADIYKDRGVKQGKTGDFTSALQSEQHALSIGIKSQSTKESRIFGNGQKQPYLKLGQVKGSHEQAIKSILFCLLNLI